MRRRIEAVLVHAALVAGALVAIAPLAWMVSASFMAPGEASGAPPPLLPRRPTLEHYRALFARLALGRYLWNSALVAGLVTASSAVLNSLAGYAFAKLRFRGRDRLFRGLALGLLIPVQVGMLPLFLLLERLGLVNTYAGVVVPGLASIFGIFLVRQAALALPDDLLDAARIDGAGELRIYVSLVLPLLAPALATLAVWTFLASWNDFLWPLVVLSDERRYTLPVALANLAGEHVQDTELMMAGSVLTVAPVLGVFLFLQRAYVRGILAGGLKG